MTDKQRKQTPKSDPVPEAKKEEAPVQKEQAPPKAEETPDTQEVKKVIAQEPAPPKRRGVNLGWIACHSCTWGGNDWELSELWQIPESQRKEDYNSQDLFCPGCRVRIIDARKAHNDEDYRWYGYDFDDRERRIKARRERHKECDPKGYERTESNRRMVKADFEASRR